MKEVSLFTVITKGEKGESVVKHFEKLDDALFYAHRSVLNAGESCMLSNETYMVEE